jgi:hypothetical protein
MDPLLTDPDKYKLVLENERVRVLAWGTDARSSALPCRDRRAFQRRTSTSAKMWEIQHTRADDRAQGAAPKQER